jgi:hypothetical protein
MAVAAKHFWTKTSGAGGIKILSDPLKHGTIVVGRHLNKLTES